MISRRMLLALAAALGGTWFRRGSQDAASDVFQEREAAYRANNIGVARLEQFDPERAVERFREALEIAPDLPIARVNLAIALFYAPDLAAARREAETAVRQTPDLPHAHYVLGLIAKSENRIDEALQAFTEVLAVDPRDVGALVNLGQLEMQERRYDAAIGRFEQAVEAEPYNATAVYNLGVALTRGDRRDEGAEVMARFQTLRESGVATTFSNTYLEQGRYAEALSPTGAEPDLVDEATPAVRFEAAETLQALGGDDQAAGGDDPVARLAREAGRGSLFLADLDGDGRLELIDVSPEAVRLFRMREGRLADVSSDVGLGAPVPGAVLLGAVVGDYDNDGRPDLFVVGYGRHVLYRQTESGRFEDVTEQAGIPPADGIWRAAAFVDIDHDGDLDLFLAGAYGDLETARAAMTGDEGSAAGDGASLDERLADVAPAPNVLLRNNGDGTFTEAAAEAGLAETRVQARAVMPTDFDNRRDVDLLVAGRGGVMLYQNMREGTFDEVAEAIGIPGGETTSCLAAGDVNKNGFTDFYFGRPGQPGLLVMSTGDGRYAVVEDGPATPDVSAALFVDYDNDGLLDLVLASPAGLHVWRNVGRAWTDVTGSAFADQPLSDPAMRPVGLAAGDLTGDGMVDLVVKSASGAVTVWRNGGGSGNRALSVRLAAQVSNRSGYGSKVEIRAGSLWQKVEYVSAWPAPVPADLTFGLGRRAAADVVRVLWPAGILQAELPPEAPAEEAGPQVMTLTELDRKPSSCPYLFTWNGERFTFVTDFLGGGEMGYLLAPGVYNTPDPVEYVRIRDDQLRARDGRYEIRVTNELEEALFLDHVQLLAVTHAAEEAVYPNEGMTSTPKPYRLFVVRDARVPRHVVDHAGRDVTGLVVRLDRRFVDGLPLERIRGYAKLHTLTIRPAGQPASSALSGSLLASRRVEGPSSDPEVLLLTGWTDYAFSSDNRAAHQAGLQMVPPQLQVRDRAGEWRTVIDEIGIPVGRPQTVPVDLRGVWLSDSRELRIVTSMRIYWDRIQVATIVRTVDSLAEEAGARMERLDPVGAVLRWRGFSEESAVTADGRQPLDFEYARTRPTSPWKTMAGRYTREGDVRTLLAAPDDRYVIARPGDEIALSFDAAALAPLPPGAARTFLLHADGYSKEMDRNSASPDITLPLPFHGMTRYPYEAPEAYPDTPAHRLYRDEHNTRVIRRSVPLIETTLLDR